MKWTEEAPQWFKRWFWIGLAFVLVILAMATCNGTPAKAATAPAAPAPITFTDQAPLDTVATADRLLSATGHNKSGPCWGWDHAWPVTDWIGTEYSFGVRVTWCANRKRTRVAKLVNFNCYDAGGYYDYDGCHKHAGSLGYASLGLSTSYKYHHSLG